MRIGNRVVAAVVAAALIVGGLVVAAEVFIAQVLKREPWIVPYDDWLDSAQRTTWAESAAVLQIAVASLIVGGLLLLMQLVRRRPTTLPVDVGDGMQVEVQRRSLERSLGRTAEQVDAVDTARARLRRGELRVRVATNRRLAPDLEATVTEAVHDALRSAHTEPEPHVRVTVTRRDST